MTTTSSRGEQRSFSRIPGNGTVEVVTGATSRRGVLCDLSLKGALVGRPPGWQGHVGDRCRLEIRLDHSERPISMEAIVAHVEAERIGFCCRHIDIDSASELKRLVELNLGDPALLHRELSALCRPS